MGRIQPQQHYQLRDLQTKDSNGVDSRDDPEQYMDNNERRLDPTQDQKMNQPNDKPFPLLSLPAELREKIYTHLLVRHRILISYKQSFPSKQEETDPSNKRSYPKGLVAIDELPQPPTTTHPNGRRRSISFNLPTPYASPTTPAILYTCRQIHAEASYILYTKNCFDFTTMPAVHPFLSLIGPRNRSFLTRVRLSSWNRLGWKYALEALRDGPDLGALREVGVGVWKFDTYEAQWGVFLREVEEGFVFGGDGDVERQLGRLRFFVGGREVWEGRKGNVMGSAEVEREGMRELRRYVEECCLPRSYEKVSSSDGIDDGFGVSPCARERMCVEV